MYFDPFDPTQLLYSPLPENATKEELEQYRRLTMTTLRRGLITFLAVLALMALFTLFTGCNTPQTLTVERTIHDTITVTRHQHDSVFLHDSICVREHNVGDTVFIEINRWHTKYRDRWHHDSIYIVRRDSIPVPYPVEKPVPQPLTTWQQLEIWLGRLLFIAIAIAAGVFIIRRWLIMKKIIP